MYYLRDNVVERLVTIISVVVAAYLLVGSIVTPYFVRNAGARLGLLGAFRSSLCNLGRLVDEC